MGIMDYDKIKEQAEEEAKKQTEEKAKKLTYEELAKKLVKEEAKKHAKEVPIMYAEEQTKKDVKVRYKIGTIYGGIESTVPTRYPPHFQSSETDASSRLIDVYLTFPQKN